MGPPVELDHAGLHERGEQPMRRALAEPDPSRDLGDAQAVAHVRQHVEYLDGPVHDPKPRGSPGRAPRAFHPRSSAREWRGCARDLLAGMIRPRYASTRRSTSGWATTVPSGRTAY